jgi:tRNA dimethylallyltransferase
VNEPTVLCIAGPTAVGKTALALDVAKRLPVEIISVDSAMVYRGLDIGTAKPSRDVLDRFPHHLIDIRDPQQAYSAGEFRRDALALIERIQAAGRLPLLVGGSLLYFRALMRGLAPLPRADPELRSALDARGAAEGWPALHGELAAVDPQAAARIAPTDRQRIQRALEVHTIAGRPISELQRENPPAPEIRFLCFALLTVSRAELYARIAERFDRMLEQGLVEEVRTLRALPGMRADLPAMRAVGYRQLWEHLDGACTLEEARGRAVTATRRYAKRQLTWLRSDAAFRRLAQGSAATADELVRQLSVAGALDALCGSSG